MKIESALINFAISKKELTDINKRIGEAITLTIENQPKGEDSTKSYWLGMAYQYSNRPTPYNDRCYENHEDDVEGYLKKNCIHALEAHMIIQERKVIKKQHGINKAVISRMATKLLEAKLDNI